MPFEFNLPDIGEGVTEGEIVSWHVEVGQRVREDEPLVEVMTDKATVTIGAPCNGVVTQLACAVGETIEVGKMLVTLDPDEGALSQPPGIAAEGARAVGAVPDAVPGAPVVSGSAAPAGASPLPSQQGTEKALATPATRRLARELRIDLRQVRGTGAGGRVTKEDLVAHASRVSTVRGERRPSFKAPKEGEQRQPFVGIRRKIAERMQAAKNTAAHFTFVEECDCERLIEIRQRLKSRAREAGVDLTYLPFIVKAVVQALERYPILNAMLDEEAGELCLRNHHHIGVATATDQGLLVPVLRHAGQKSLLTIASEIQDLSHRAREGALSPAELSGSTFTITSLGKTAGLLATPILNFPEVGILGVHRIKEKPVVRDGSIQIGRVMNLSLSFDHRIVDGHVGAAFAYEIIHALEEPAGLLLTL